MADPASWDLLDENCSDISDWVDADKAGDIAVSEVDPAGQFRFDTNLGAAGDHYAWRYRDIGDCPNTYTLEIKLYHDLIGSSANYDHFTILFNQADEKLNVAFGSNGIFIYDTDSGWTEVGTNLVKYGGNAEWQMWRFLVTFGVVGDGVCDVYLYDSTYNWEKVGTDIPCSQEATYTDGVISLIQYGYTTNDQVNHSDHVKIATGLYPPTGPVNLKSVDGVLKTNITSIGGVAIGSIKSIVGIE